MGHYLQERNPCTPEMKQIIEKESNLLNKIISHFFHIGLGWPAGPLTRYKAGLGQQNSSLV